MSIIAIPDDLMATRQDFGIKRFDVTFTNPDSGASQTAIFGPPRRTCAIVGPELAYAADAARWRTLVHALQGKVNQLAVYDLLNPTPRGTARGTWTAALTSAAGSSTLLINVTGGAGTILQGDWIGVNQGGVQRQLLHVQEDAVVVNGQIGLTVSPAIRVAVPAGSPIVWDRPTCLMRQTGDESHWSSSQALQGGFSLDLMEAWG